MAELVPLAEFRRRPGLVFFDRREFNKLLQLYARRVAQGEWRDYAIDQHADRAAFAVFRRASERPLFVVSKIAEARRPRRYVLSSGIRRLGVGRSIDEVVDLLERVSLETG
jgi:phenylalanyl-tRNA synthetase beta subunit